MGTISPSHGSDLCLAVLDKLDINSTLTLKGVFVPESYRNKVMNKYSKHIKKGRLIIDDSYSPQDEIIQYLSIFDIGFCFYDFSMININDFNYISCPSGKLFNYYAAGIPVIGNCFLGLKTVTDFKAGVLLDHVTPETIISAIKQIEKDYDNFSKNGLEAAVHFDFKRAFDRFLEDVTLNQ
jgi:hypothetical protein